MAKTADKIKCPSCPQLFPKTPKGIEAYRLHKAEHRTGEIPVRVPKVPEKIELTPLPDDMKAGHDANPALQKPEESVKPPTPEAKLVAPPVLRSAPKPQTGEKIELTYHYVGQCETCGADVATLDVETGKAYVVIAYCLNCRKKLRERPVIKL